MPLQGSGKIVAGELAALVGIEYLRSAIARERFLECLDATRSKQPWITLPGDDQTFETQPG